MWEQSRAGGFFIGGGMQTIRTPEKEAKVLRRLALGYSVANACRYAKISRSSYYEWRKEDPAFEQSTDGAIEEGTDRLEDEAMRRATMRGEPSDTLLIFLLKGRRPEKYRERFETKHVGHDGGPIQYVEAVRPASEGDQ